jgi:hypothetical protein
VNIYDRDTEWGCQDGRWIKIRDLEDTHLANIIKHLEIYGYNDGLRDVMIEEAVARGLKPEFLERAHIPYKNSEGKWMLWSTEKRNDIEVG